MGEYEPNDSRNVTGANTQAGGGQMGSGQAGGGAQPQQFEADRQHAGGQPGGGEAHARAGNDDGLASSAMGGDQSVASQIREHMAVIGADGVPLGTVDHVEGHRIKLTKRDSGAGYDGEQHSGHHHYLSLGLVAAVEGDTVRLSANADVAYGMEEEEGDA